MASSRRTSCSFKQIGDALREDFGSIIVEIKPGAASRIALTAVKNAKPDGETSSPCPEGRWCCPPHVYQKLDYDPVNDFTPTSVITDFQFGIVAGPASKANNAATTMSLANTDPKHASYESPGAGNKRDPQAPEVPTLKESGINMVETAWFAISGPADLGCLGGREAWIGATTVANASLTTGHWWVARWT